MRSFITMLVVLGLGDRLGRCGCGQARQMMGNRLIAIL